MPLKLNATMHRVRQLAQLLLVSGGWSTVRRNQAYLSSKLLTSQQLVKRKGGLLLCSAFVVHAFGFKSGKGKMDFTEVDKLFDEAKYQEVIDALEPKRDEGNDDLMWRLARSKFQRSKLLGSDAEKKVMLQDAFALAQKALQINDKNFANHKWSGIILDAISQLEGNKERITQSLTVKAYIMKAVELNPNDATLYHVLGVWCFSFADLSWIQRKAAAVIFATPPTSSFEEALTYFEKGEEVNPGWYTNNLVMLGKTYMRLKNNEKAIEALKKAKSLNVVSQDDKNANKEATDLLASLGVKS